LHVSPYFSEEPKAIANNNQEFEQNAFALSGFGTDGLCDIEWPGNPEYAEHNNFTYLCDVDQEKSLSFFFY
jgi:hypothetical protein